VEKLLTKEVLDFLEPETIFATGILPDTPNGINMMSTGKNLRWVAITGNRGDWSVYCHFDKYSAQYISESGEKVYTKAYIRRCVNCTDEAFERYRY
jgi:hypothetical protein